MRLARIPALLCAAALVFAQSPAPREPASAAPPIRTGTRLVLVDVVVRNGDGPVTGLAPDDFTVLDEGKPQEIFSFDVTAARDAKPAALPPGAVSNRGGATAAYPANATVILLDRLNTAWQDQTFAKRKVLKFLRSMEPGTPIALYSLGRQLTVVQELTADPERLVRAANRLDEDGNLRDGLVALDAKPNDPDGALAPSILRDSVQEIENVEEQIRVAATARALRTIARHLEGLPGRKSLIWVSSAFELFLTHAPQAAGSKVEMQTDRTSFAKTIEGVTRLLNDANVAVYPVDARGLMGMGGTVDLSVSGKGPRITPLTETFLINSSQAPHFDTMNLVASLTGGKSFYNNNAVDDGVRRAMEDGEVTYTLGFSPPAASLDGEFHALKVNVARRGIDVRYRRGYYATLTPGPGAQTTLAELAGAPLDATGIGLEASAEPVPDRPGTYKVRLSVNVRDLHLENHEGAWTGSVYMGFASDERNAPGTAVPVAIRLTAEQLEAELRDGHPISFEADVPPGTGRIRLVVEDRSTGAAGTLRLPLQ